MLDDFSFLSEEEAKEFETPNWFGEEITYNKEYKNAYLSKLNELSKLKSFLTEYDCPNSIEALACDTGISVKNLNRFLDQKDFSEFASKVSYKDNKNISIEL